MDKTAIVETAVKSRLFAARGLDASADRQEIKERYRQLVRVYHPDMNGGKRSHEKKLNAVMRAYKWLGRNRHNDVA